MTKSKNNNFEYERQTLLSLFEQNFQMPLSYETKTKIGTSKKIDFQGFKKNNEFENQ